MNNTLANHFWLCQNLYNFWSFVFRWYSSVFNANISPDPITALFGYSRMVSCVVLRFSMTIAKRGIIKMWKSESAPQFEIWLRELTDIQHVERLRYGLSGKLRSFLVYGTQ